MKNKKNTERERIPFSHLGGRQNKTKKTFDKRVLLNASLGRKNRKYKTKLEMKIMRRLTNRSKWNV